MNKRGFIESEIKTGDYVLGSATQLKGEVFFPDGHGWGNYLPPREDQSRDGFEPFACVSFAIAHAVETLIRKKFLTATDLSSRFLAYATGTKDKNGNDPTTVCTFLGTKGDVENTDWPYPTPATDFYNPPPQNLYTLALEFPLHYHYDNQWVPATPEKMKDALTRSPLTVAGYAWAQRDNGLYYWPDGEIADHYFVIYDYIDGVKWLAFDTYANEYKELEWTYPFIQVKEHSLTNQVVVPSFWDNFVRLLRQILGLDASSLGAARSPQWRDVERAWVKDHPLCDYGNHKPTLLNPLNVHHVEMFSKNPLRELDVTNLQSVCRFHHLYHSHFGNWKDENPQTREDAKAFTNELNLHRQTSPS